MSGIELDLRWCTLLLFLIDFGSFAWGMHSLFSRPTGKHWEMKAVELVGGLFFGFQLIAILLHPAHWSWNLAASWLLYLASGVLFWSSVWATRHAPLSWAFSRDEPCHIIRSGVFNVLRHPFYTSYLLAWLAGVLATLEPILVIAVLVMGSIYREAAKLEEGKFACSSLSDGYDRYRRETGAFFPKIWRTRNSSHFQRTGR